MSEYTLEDLAQLFKQMCSINHRHVNSFFGKDLLREKPRRILAHTHYVDVSNVTPNTEDKYFYLIENWKGCFVLLSGYRDEMHKIYKKEKLSDMCQCLRYINPHVLLSLQRHTTLSAREKLALFPPT